MKILIAIVIFSAVILIHELGHFLFAKLNKVVVTEFSLGMGPRLVSKVIGGTRYSIKALPLGGSCMMLGEDTGMEKLRGSFNDASVWGRISIVAAGPIFNFLLAVLLSVVIVAGIGYEPATILKVEEGSPEEAAGLQENDILVEYDGYHIDLGMDMFLYSYLHELKEEPVTLKVKRGDEIKTITYTPAVSVRYLLGFNRTDAESMKVASLIPGMPLEEAGVVPGDEICGINGVMFDDSKGYDAYIEEHPLGPEEVTVSYRHEGLVYNTKIVPGEYRTPKRGFVYNTSCVKAKNWQEVIKYGLIEVKYMIRSTFLSLKEFLTGRLGMDDLSGPVGVVDAIGETYAASKPQGALILWMNMLNMAVLLSANLGVMNLLPIPALDGGRLVFLFLEAIRRKPLNRELEAKIHFTGLMLLLMLMIYVMYHDITRLF